MIHAETSFGRCCLAAGTAKLSPIKRRRIGRRRHRRHRQGTVAALVVAIMKTKRRSTLWPSVVLNAMATAEWGGGVRATREEWRQHHSSQHQGKQQQRYTRRKQTTSTRRELQTWHIQTQQQRQRQRQLNMKNKENNKNPPGIQISREACDKVVKLHAKMGGYCSCLYDTTMETMVTLECAYPDCEHCVDIDNNDGSDGTRGQLCATRSTATIFANGVPGETPAEASHTECLAYTRGRSDTLCFTVFRDGNNGLLDECFFEVNGEYCNTCTVGECGVKKSVQGLQRLECSNVESGATWDVCGRSFHPGVPTGSVFVAFSNMQQVPFDGCPKGQRRWIGGDFMNSQKRVGGLDGNNKALLRIETSSSHQNAFSQYKISSQGDDGTSSKRPINPGEEVNTNSNVFQMKKEANNNVFQMKKDKDTYGNNHNFQIVKEAYSNNNNFQMTKETNNNVFRIKKSGGNTVKKSGGSHVKKTAGHTIKKRRSNHSFQMNKTIYGHIFKRKGETAGMAYGAPKATMTFKKRVKTPPR